MLPKFLFGSYKQYKEDTAQSTAWLQRTAASCGANVAPLVDVQEDVTTEEHPVGDGVRHRIPLGQFPVLARAIAAPSSQKFSVPEFIVSSIRRALLLRKQCLAWLSRHVKEDSDDNSSHAHFVAILEETLCTLGVVISFQDNHDKATSTPPKPPRALRDLTNRYTVLELEGSGLEERLEDASDLRKSSGPIKHSDLATYDLFDDQLEDGEAAEAIFALFCLMQDLQRIRDFLKQTWLDYRKGKIDVMSAAVTTNTAVDVARHATAELLSQNPVLMASLPKEDRSPERAECLSLIAYSAVCEEKGKNPIGGDLEYDVAEFTYLQAHIILESFSKDYLMKNEPFIPDGAFGVYDLDKERSKLTPRELVRDDFRLLFDSMTSFLFCSKLEPPLPVEDQLTRCIREFFKTKKIPLWLSFAIQVHIDIHHVLDGYVRRGWQDLRLHALRAKKILREHFSLTKEQEPDPCWVNNDDFSRWILMDIGLYVENNAFSLVLKETTEWGKTGRSWSRFFETHPWLAGLLSFNINLRMQEAGIGLVNTWGMVIYLGCLYTATQQVDSVAPSWPDMEKIIEFDGEDHFFFGGKPRNLVNIFKKLMLSNGTSAQLMASWDKGRPIRQRKQRATRQPRGLQNSTTISDIFRKRYCYQGSIDLSFVNVEKVLNDLTTGDSESSNKARMGSRTLKRHWQTNQKLGPVQLLAALRERLVEEEPRLLFNYFSMHFHALNLLRNLASEFRVGFYKINGPQGLDYDYELHEIVLYILAWTSQCSLQAEAGRFMKSKKQGNVAFTSNVLVRAGQLMREYLKDTGDIACKELRVFCKNKSMLTMEERAEREEPVHWYTVEDVILSSRCSCCTCREMKAAHEKRL